MRKHKPKLHDDKTVLAIAICQDEITSLNKFINKFRSAALTVESTGGETTTLSLVDSAIAIRALQARREHLQGEVARLRSGR